MPFETINLGNQPTGTGGDTARSAFEKVNKNFITAEVLASSMSQAQFEAIRAQNNERYAASGFVHFGKHGQGSGDVAVNQGLYINPVLVNHMRLGRPDIQNAGGLSKTDYPEINIAGVIFDIKANSSAFSYLDIKLHSAPDGKTTYNKSTGANVVYATTTAAFNAAAVDVNAEVVTDRVDMWGFESFLEEVSATNPYVYPNGLIQSLATTMDGITTSASNRPITYYAWFAGDTGSKGKGVNYFTLTDAQKRKVLANHKNNLYFLDDGRLVQWRVRGRSFAGAGNGDWSGIEAGGAASNIHFSWPNNSLILQGKNESVSLYGNATSSGLMRRDADYFGSGIFGTINSASSVAINGECYFLVCGTVNRLNQGAYHPSFNPSGTARLFSATQETNFGYWYDLGRKEVTSTSQLFIVGSYPNAGLAGFAYRGDISANVSGRPDGRFYDAIYDSGQGGVCRDMRYSANHTTLEKFAEADLKVKNGTYRGFEKPVKTTFFSNAYKAYYAAENAGNALMTYSAGGADGGLDMYENGLTAYSPIIMWQPATGKTLYGVISAANGYVRVSTLSSRRGQAVHTSGLFGNDTTNPWYLAKVEDVDVSEGGSFLQTDVIGDPANILLTNALKDGWEGSWIPQIPDGTSKGYNLVRKCLLSTITIVNTESNGASWGVTNSVPVSQTLNTYTTANPTNGIRLYQYQAFAKQTEPTVNAAVYGGYVGIGGVLLCSYYDGEYGSIFSEGLLGVINKTNLSPTNTTIPLSTYGATGGDGKLNRAGINSPTHSQIGILGVAGASGCKALDYNVSINQQAFKQYVATELKHDGTDWGDDSRIHIVDNENVLTDLNGNTVKVVTHKLKEPIGWIKNTI